MRAAAAIVSLVVGAALVAASSACDEGGAKSPNTEYGDCEVSGRRGEFRLPSPETAGALTVKTTLPAPGWWNGDTPGSVKSGYEYCMAANIAYRSGLDRVDVKNAPFPEVVSGRTKDFDLALAQITITPQRSKVAEFSPPYLDSTLGVLVRDGERINEDNIRDVRIGVADGTTGEDFVKDRLRPTKPVTAFPNDPGMVTALEKGSIDAIVHDTTILLAYPQKREGRVRLVGQYRTDQGYGALYPKGSPNRGELDRIIRQLIDDGTLAKLSAVYLGAAFGQDPDKIPYFTVGGGS
ncbi:ABC transporter substrate-binding protein [Streptomyces fructofermentans]|uniref:Cysteine ABC transporter substrate-binding protein n=1 Tax=Streptomyces fructofermentans TaxID=152141 RepID=A0A918NMJ3_9ACTN|nr:ABC transporter substrate-binding protein [Streptomyces fructofermentans]GGX81132.1 cysteine ABC transporter substrate-binding protein [Streptomyces fructofermentans]